MPRRNTLGVVCGAARCRTAAQRLKVGVGEIAKMLAEKQMKKLYLSQVERILSSDVLQTVYSAKMKAGADQFSGLFGA